MRSGSGSFTRSRMAMILALRWAASRLVWVFSTSSICSPQVMTGLSAVIGSWKIIDMRVQRSSRSRVSSAARMFSPCSRISPELGFSALASRPMTVKAITDLPEPDSPTRQTISPRIDGEAHLVDGELAVGALGQRDGEVADFEDWLLGFTACTHHTFLLIFGSSVSRRPSPMMLIASTVKARKMPG